MDQADRIASVHIAVALSLLLAHPDVEHGPTVR